MKKHTLEVVVFAMALLAGSIAIAQSHKGDVLVNVPFSFVAGGHQLPAGRYTVTKFANDFIRMSGVRGSNQSVFLGTIGVVGERKEPKLIFHRYGDSYFLTQVWSSDWGKQLPESKAEKELASSQASRIRTGAEVAVIRAEQ